MNRETDTEIRLDPISLSIPPSDPELFKHKATRRSPLLTKSPV